MAEEKHKINPPDMVALPATGSRYGVFQSGRRAQSCARPKTLVTCVGETVGEEFETSVKSRRGPARLEPCRVVGSFATFFRRGRTRRNALQ